MSLDLVCALNFGSVGGRDRRTRSCKNRMREVWRPNALPCWLSNVLSKFLLLIRILGLACAAVGKKCHGNPRHQMIQIMDDLLSLCQSLQQIEFMSIPKILDHPRMFSGDFSHPSSIINPRLGYVLFVVKILIGRHVGCARWH